MKGMTIAAMTKACGGVYHGPEDCIDKVISAVTIDSRNVTRDGLFIAIKGERSDGHNYIAGCYEAGVLCCVSEKELESDERPYIQVESTLQALKDLAEL